MRLDGKVAVVTGGGSGFGAGIVQLFAAEGARVVVADVNERAAEEVAAGIDAVAVAADVTREDDTKRMIDAATGRFGRLDILVNNAGVTHVEPADDRGERGRLRPGLRRQRQGDLLGRQARGPGACARRAAG